MTRTIVAALVGLGLIAGAGCNKSTEGGASSGGNTFTLKGSSGSTDVKQGETKNIDITIGHGSDFKDNIALTATTEGKGLTVKIDPASVPATTGKAVLMVTVAADAPLGKSNVKITGKPGTGNATTVEDTINVIAK